jgi:hypothetical protein
MGSACSILMGKSEGKGPLGTPRPRWVHSIKIDLGVMGWGVKD